MTSTSAAPAAPPGAVVGDIEQFLREAIEQLAPDAGAAGGPGRPRVLPALCLWAGLLVCVLRGFSSQLALWRLLTRGGLWFFPRFPVSDQAIYKRLAAAGTAPLERLFVQISAVLALRLAPYAATDLAPFASAVVALDETALDGVARTLPMLRALPPGDARLLPGKLAGAFDLRCQQWCHIRHIADPQQNEKVAAREVLAALPVGSLVLADLGYFGFRWFDDLTDRGDWWVSRLRQKTSYTVIHACYQQGDTFDGLVWLGAHRADRREPACGWHAVRLVQFRQDGTLYRYVTNVRDPAILPLAEVARLYARRWDFELAVKTVKRHLGLHLLWSAKEAVILQQVWATLTVAQILQALQLEIAGRAGADPFEVSLALLVAYLPQFAYTGEDPVAFFVTHGRALRLIRPSTRTRIRAPSVPAEALALPPPHLALLRTPRYAHRNCGKRTTYDN